MKNVQSIRDDEYIPAMLGTNMYAKFAILSAIALVGVFVSLFGSVANICGLIAISMANISILTLAVKQSEPAVVHDVENPPL